MTSRLCSVRHIINAVDNEINAINEVVHKLAEIDIYENIVNVEDYVEDYEDS